MPTIINISNVRHTYRTFSREGGLLSSVKDLVRRKHVDTTALQEVSLTVDKGEIVGILGPNGAGKTTLLKILSGLLRPTKGEVKVLGQDPHRKHAPFLERIGVVLGQRTQLQWDLPVMDTLRLLRDIYGVPTQTFKQRLANFLNLMEVEDQVHLPVRSLSLGQRMKFELIASLLHAPELLFLDEPTLGLDIMSQETIRSFLLQINQEQSTTILITSHYMRDIEVMAPRVAVISQGELTFDGKVEALIKQCPIQEQIVFTLPTPPNLPEYTVIERSPGEYTITCESGQLATAIQAVTQRHEVQSLRTQTPSLEDAMLALLRRATP